MKNFSILILILFISNQVSYTQDFLSGIESEIQSCFKKQHYTTNGMTECTFEAIPKIEQEIKKYNSKILKTLPQDQKYTFYKNHHQWEEYKNAQINLINNISINKKGTIYQNIAAGKILELYENRIRFLQELYEMILE